MSKKLLKEDAQFGQYISADEAMEYFVGPIMDVFKVATIALKDIGKGVLYNVRIAFTFSTTKKQRLLNAYNQSKEMIDKEYGEVMARVDKNLGPAKALAFAANPPAFLAFYATKKGLDAATFLKDVYVEQSKALEGEGPDGKPTKPEDGPLLGALSDLKRIFFGESYIVGAIMEAGGSGESADLEAEIKSGMEKIGVDPESIVSNFKDWVAAKEEVINSVNEEGLPSRMEALMAMMKSEDYESLKKAVTDAKSAGVDLGNYLSDFEKEFDSQKKEIVSALEKDKEDRDKSGNKESELLTKIKEMPEIKKLGDKAKEEDYLKALEDSLFMTLKKNLQEDGEKILGEIKKDIGELVQIITAPFANEKEVEEFSKVSPEAKAIADEMLKSYKQLTGN